MNIKTTHNPLLSVVIISHNQRDSLKRCIDSVLQQKTSFHVQIIVSDDRSTDGTAEMLLTEYRSKVLTTFFNSDKYDTVFTLERASYNRINGLKHAVGKYLINIDGDDFFTSCDLFQVMVDTLEKHPECNLCCQNYCVLDSDNVGGVHHPQCQNELMKHDGIVSAKTFFSQVKYLHASCFIVRRYKNFSEENLLGIPYDDNTIPVRYIGDGDVAVLNRCDFVYVQYGDSTCATMSSEDKSIIFLPELFMARLAPSLAGVFMRRNLGAFSYIARLVLSSKYISEDVKHFFSHCDIMILRDLNKKNKLRYLIIYIWTCIIFAFHLHSSLPYRILYRLAIGPLTSEVKF